MQSSLKLANIKYILINIFIASSAENVASVP